MHLPVAGANWRWARSTREWLVGAEMADGRAKRGGPTRSPHAATDGKCPFCGQALGGSAVLCVRCGYNRRTGERLRTALEDAATTAPRAGRGHGCDGSEGSPEERGLGRVMAYLSALPWAWVYWLAVGLCGVLLLAHLILYPVRLCESRDIGAYDEKIANVRRDLEQMLRLRETYRRTAAQATGVGDDESFWNADAVDNFFDQGIRSLENRIGGFEGVRADMARGHVPESLHALLVFSGLFVALMLLPAAIRRVQMRLSR
jgi:hypothetical protein